MKAWYIFAHSVRQLFGNLKSALAMSVPLLLLVLGVSLYVYRDMLFMDNAAVMEEALGTENLLIDAASGTALGLLQMFISVWIAVGWHRFVLLNEETGFLPRFRGGRMAAYVGKSLIIGLIIMIPLGAIMLLLLSMFSSALSPANFFMITVFGLLFFVPAISLSMRLGIALPAMALGEPTSLRQIWRATEGEVTTFVGLTVIFLILGFFQEFLQAFIADSWIITAIIWRFACDWFALMLGLSVLTTLYGHYIQRRDLV